MLASIFTSDVATAIVVLPLDNFLVMVVEIRALSTTQKYGHLTNHEFCHIAFAFLDENNTRDWCPRACDSRDASQAKVDLSQILWRAMHT